MCKITKQEFIKPKRVVVDALKYLSEVLKNGIEKDLQENQILCSVCNGTGLAITNIPYGLSNDPNKTTGHFPYKNQYISSCNNCYSGVVDLCNYCENPLDRRNTRCGCVGLVDAKNKERLQKQQLEWDKAIKISADNEIAKNMGMYYSEKYPYNEGYFSEIEDFIEYWNDVHEPDEITPKYLWGTSEEKLNIDAYDIVGSACEDLYEDAIDYIGSEEIDNLQNTLNDWCSRQDIIAYFQDTKYAIEIPWEGK